LNGPQSLVLIGGGEHATVVADAARSRPEQWRVIGYCDLAPTAKMASLGLPFLPDDPARLPADAFRIVALGGAIVSPLRRALVQRHDEHSGLGWATVVHAGAHVAPTAMLGAGTLVCAGALINPSAVVGAHVIVNTGAIVEHDVTLGDFVHAGPGVVLGGGASVGEGSFLGLGCRVRDHIQIGAGVTVGMGSVVIGSVAPGAVVMGIPARPRPPDET
jgi:acetyltransferase EpsM